MYKHKHSHANTHTHQVVPGKDYVLFSTVGELSSTDNIITQDHRPIRKWLK